MLALLISFKIRYRDYFNLGYFYFFLNVNSVNNFNDDLAILSLFIATFLRIMPSLNRLINSLQIVKYSSYSVDKLSDEMQKISNNLIKDNSKKN